MEKNKIQLRECTLLFPGGRESKRREQQEQLECRAGSETAASGNGGAPGGGSLSPALLHSRAHLAVAEAQHCIRSLGTNTAEAQTSLSGLRTAPRGSQERNLPISSHGWSRVAADVPNPYTSCCQHVLAQPNPTAARSAAPSERGERPLPALPADASQAAHAVQDQKLGEVMLPVEVLQLMG